eukprot:1157779-Pelagomonas_calceolata.AAC.4
MMDFRLRRLILPSKCRSAKTSVTVSCGVWQSCSCLVGATRLKSVAEFPRELGACTVTSGKVTQCKHVCPSCACRNCCALHGTCTCAAAVKEAHSFKAP